MRCLTRMMEHPVADFLKYETITVAGANPIFSPDGKKIAYIRRGVIGKGDLWLANIDGTEKKMILKNRFFGNPSSILK